MQRERRLIAAELAGNIGKLNATSTSMAPNNCLQKECILAIDDEAGFLGLLKMQLESQGYAVHTASNPQEAIKVYQERGQEIGMVLLDYLLPQMSGDLVFDELQRLNPEVRVVLLTGCEKSVAAKLFQRGLRGYLRKPFRLPALVQQVKNTISSPPSSSAASPSLS